MSLDSGRIDGFVGDEAVQIELSVDSDHRWRLNGRECPVVAGCIDIDLAFSPSTNMLPIRRLNLAIGQEAKVRAAWLRFPGFNLEPLEQLYRRIDARFDALVKAADQALDASAVGFTGYFPAMPIRHGMTMGELAQLFNGENKIGADLTVIKMKNWKRDEWFDETALPWVNPSPNMRNLNEATLYPGIGAIEGTNISVGRGTDTPFEVVGAPYIDDLKLADEMNRAGLPGVRFVPIRFTPTYSVHKERNLPLSGGFKISEQALFATASLKNIKSRSIPWIFKSEYIDS